MAQEHKESSSIGCGLLIICLLSDIFWMTYYWEKLTQFEYWPYLIGANIMIWIILIWYFCFYKK